MAESMVAGMYGSGGVAESYILIYSQGKTETLSLAWAFETTNPTPSDTLPPTKPHLLILLIISKDSILW